MTLVVLGTDTDVGKTVVSAALCARYAPLHYWKPIATGSTEGRDSETVRSLVGPTVSIEAEVALFRDPVSPHLAARRERRVIDLGALTEELTALERRTQGALIVEGVGGVLVPLDDQGTLLADWIARLDRPVLLVARSRLGTINHTVLTLEALRARGIEPCGVILAGEPNADNREAIERFGRCRVIGELPWLESLDSPAVRNAALGVDPRGSLAAHLTPRATPPTEAGAPAWLAADHDHVWHPYTPLQPAAPPIAIARGEGAYLHTVDGRRLLDGISSWWVNLHGHAPPRLLRALATQSQRLSQVIFAGFTHRPAAELAAALVARAPRGLEHVFYSDDGSTAVEVAIKIAHQSWLNRGARGRSLLVALEHGYHGDTFGAMAVGAGSIFHAAFRDLLPEVRRVRAPCCRRGTGCEGRRSPDLADVLALEGDRVSAVIVEPMLQGAGGMRVHPPEFLAEVRALTQQSGIPLIADEVLTGFGRTGRLFAVEHAGVTPDLMCLSKGLTGGLLPLGATLVTGALYQSFVSEDRSKTLFHGHSYTGNALACAVAKESLEMLEDQHALARVERLEAIFRRRLERLAASDRVADVRGIGAVAAIELRSSGGYLDPIGPRLQRAFIERGLLLRPLGNVIYALPPYVISDEEAEWMMDQIEEVVASL